MDVSWTIKKTECQRIDAFELWCWRRLLRVTWTVRRSNQSILKEINPEYSLEGLMLKLHLMWRANSLEKTQMLGRLRAGEVGGRGWDGWMASPTQWTWVWASSGRWWRTRKPGMLQSMDSQNWTQLNDWIAFWTLYHLNHILPFRSVTFRIFIFLLSLKIKFPYFFFFLDCMLVSEC